MSIFSGLMNQLSLSKKMVVIAAGFLIPLLVTFFFLASSLTQGIKQAEHERKGLEYINTLRSLYQHMPQHRGMTNAYLNGQSEFQSKILAKRDEIKADIAKIDAIDERLGGDLNTTATWTGIKAEWANLESRSFSEDAAKIFSEHTALIKKIYALFEDVSIESQLFTDSDIASAYIIDAVVFKIPAVTEILGRARGFGSGLAAKQSLSAKDETKLAIMMGQIETDFLTTIHDLKVTEELLPSLKGEIEPKLINAQEKWDDFSGILTRELLNADYINVDPSNVFGAGTEAIKANFALYDTVVPILDKILDERASGLAFHRNVLLIIVIISVLFSILLFRAFHISLISAIRSLVITTEQIAAGNLTAMAKVETEDEVKDIATAINKMTGELKSIVHKLGVESSSLASASEELSATTEQAKANSSAQQTQSTSIASAMTEMSSTAGEISSNAEQLRHEVEEAMTHSSHGQQVIKTTVLDINKLADSVAHAANAVRELAQSSDEIGSVLTVIKGVAEQTNLLALNAAIEAARAGEQGRGFAVVAEEVRSLATRTQDSAEQIQVMVNSLQEHTQHAAKLMDSETENALRVSQSTVTATDSIDHIVSSFGKISDMSHSVASAAEQQSLVSEEVTRNVTHVSDLSAENAAGAEQISAAAQSLTRLASDLEILVHKFHV
jgi:methyl-accepting chemotaxis protein